MVSEKITFLKLDIEGFEYDAIVDSTKHIIQDKPKLVISIYHKPEDLWNIINLIHNINKNYEFYIRHYTNTIFDTDLYCIPINQ